MGKGRLSTNAIWRAVDRLWTAGLRNARGGPRPLVARFEPGPWRRGSSDAPPLSLRRTLAIVPAPLLAMRSRDPNPPDHALFPGKAPLATRGLRDAPPSNLRKTIEIVPGERPTSLPIAAVAVVNRLRCLTAAAR